MSDQDRELDASEEVVVEALARVLSGIRRSQVKELWDSIRLVYHFVAVAIAHDSKAAAESIESLAVMSERGDIDELELWSLLRARDPRKGDRS